ncbi:SLOG family protein [Alkalibaculum bacchi]|uniref:SLOG family protein n=1 Tax=Alkalibaculum bacchi TaxID=645887 RepID=UPI001FA8F781|nr:SLOG family protein [Alkalibaculum bacchi]
MTGHRELDPSKIEPIKKALRNAIMEAIKDGYTHFISGFAEGVDLYFAEIVAELKEEHDLFLEAAILNRNRVKTKDTEFQRLLTQCNVVGIHAEEYSPSCYLVRNRFMVQSSDFIIAVYDGREKGGTLSTMRYAHALEKEVKVISV